MLARCLPGILPPMTFEEALETTRIHSIAGRMQPGSGLMVLRPFCAPHHSASVASLIGGGSNARPGEVSLAHNGVLFLDELPEFSRPALEALRQPGGWHRFRNASAESGAISSQFYVHCQYESLSLRLLWEQDQEMPLLGARNTALSGSRQRAFAGSNRYSD